VPARDLPQVRVGENVAPGARHRLRAKAVGKVAYVGALIGEQTRTAQARVVVDNPNTAWRPGLFVNVEVICRRGGRAGDRDGRCRPDDGRQVRRLRAHADGFAPAR
jgi:multidrug efflux pump subunit AcrA (membrane-fusion protein)